MRQWLAWRMCTPLTPLQSTHIFGWWDPRPTLTWADVRKRRLTLDRLISIGVAATSLAMIQPNPAEWAEHAGATLKHVRYLQPLGANPFEHFNADLADVLSLEPTFIELMRMGVTYKQLREAGMTAATEKMFKLDSEEWAMLGRPKRK